MMLHTPDGNVLVLDGLTTAQALRGVQRRVDLILAFELAQLESELIDDGLGGAEIDALLEDRREEFAEWRAGGLTELRDWLVDCNRKLH